MTIPLGIYLISRVISTVFLLAGEAHQVELSTDTSTGYFRVANNWDGWWYRSIAESGYPSTLPTKDGTVIQNEWAFLPGYPFLVRAVMSVAGLGFPVAATLVSLTCSGLAMVILFALLRPSAGILVASTAVIAVCTFPVSPVLQVAYTEGLALLLIVTTLWLIERRRYIWLLPFCIALGLTRQIVLAMAVVVFAHSVARWRGRRADPFPFCERLALAAALVVCLVMPTVWPAVAEFVTGVPDAYFLTHEAWDVGPLGIRGSWLGRLVGAGPGLFVMVGAIVAWVTLVAVGSASRTWGLGLRAWSLAYPAYVLLATRPSVSVARYLLLSIGILPALPLIEGRPGTVWPTRGQAVVIATCALIGLAGQYVWVMEVFTLTPGFQAFP